MENIFEQNIRNKLCLNIFLNNRLNSFIDTKLINNNETNNIYEFLIHK